jgi:hypothetical protein
MAKLHSGVTPFPSDVARSIVETELRRPLSELFATFDTDPLAAASTAQVHRATLLDGQLVVVKVQRPDIVPKVKADLGIIDDLLDAIEQRARARDNDIRGIFQEFSKNMLLELDYTNSPTMPGASNGPWPTSGITVPDGVPRAVHQSRADDGLRGRRTGDQHGRHGRGGRRPDARARLVTGVSNSIWWTASSTATRIPAT